MIVEITLKTPDALDDAINRTAEDRYIPDEERWEAVCKAKELAKKWFRFGETVTLVLDTDKETCEVKRL